MKLFAVGDLHEDKQLKDAVVDAVSTEEYDLFLGLGDYGSLEYYEGLAAALNELDLTHISCTGNWELMRDAVDNEEYEYLFNYARVDFDPYKIVLLGGVYPDMRQLKTELQEFLAGTEPEHVIFGSHFPPHMVCDLADLGNHGGRPEFKELLIRFKPVLWFCGHIHEAAGIQKYMNTIGINAAAADTPEAYAVELDENGVETIETVNLETGEKEEHDVPQVNV